MTPTSMNYHRKVGPGCDSTDVGPIKNRHHILQLAYIDISFKSLSVLASALKYGIILRFMFTSSSICDFLQFKFLSVWRSTDAVKCRMKCRHVTNIFALSLSHLELLLLFFHLRGLSR
ncbi:unnamed protein product [Clavelina lepadiformis]|uniref:Uncharacterized protein n=1 Tax=Clavelina lepadiformis TaxID=159417 RepID=A0ABP0G6P8_CLALP